MKNEYKRIAIIGNGGSGKSTLSRQLAERTGLPLVHLDMEFWRPGWEQTPRDEWLAKNELLTLCEKWIIDGNYNSTLEMRFAAADLVIFLDFNRFLCLYRVLKRRNKDRPDFPRYLEEKFDPVFLKWIWNFPKNNRGVIMQLHEKYPDVKFIVIKNKRELRRTLEEFGE